MASATCNVEKCRYKHSRKNKCVAFYLHIVKDSDGRPICTTFKPKQLSSRVENNEQNREAEKVKCQQKIQKVIDDYFDPINGWDLRVSASLDSEWLAKHIVKTILKDIKKDLLGEK